jgi:hypothetical protein
VEDVAESTDMREDSSDPVCVFSNRVMRKRTETCSFASTSTGKLYLFKLIENQETYVDKLEINNGIRHCDFDIFKYI